MLKSLRSLWKTARTINDFSTVPEHVKVSQSVTLVYINSKHIKTKMENNAICSHFKANEIIRLNMLHRAGTEMQILRMDLCTGWPERVALTYTRYEHKQRASRRLPYCTGSSARFSVMTWGVRWVSQREGIYVCLWLVHVAMRQKLTQHFEAIVLQLKKIEINE